MALNNFKRLLIVVGFIAIVLTAYSLLTMKEKRNPIGITSNAIRPLSSDTDVENPRP